MEIRIRKLVDVESRVLADVPFRQDVIDNIIPTLARWGVVDENGRMYESEDLTGQFVDNGTSAYFEVILGIED